MTVLYFVMVDEEFRNPSSSESERKLRSSTFNKRELPAQAKLKKKTPWGGDAVGTVSEAKRD
jgi:hypothetical protein